MSSRLATAVAALALLVVATPVRAQDDGLAPPAARPAAPSAEDVADALHLANDAVDAGYAPEDVVRILAWKMSGPTVLSLLRQHGLVSADGAWSATAPASGGPSPAERSAAGSARRTAPIPKATFRASAEAGRVVLEGTTIDGSQGEWRTKGPDGQPIYRVSVVVDGELVSSDATFRQGQPFKVAVPADAIKPGAQWIEVRTSSGGLLTANRLDTGMAAKLAVEAAGLAAADAARAGDAGRADLAPSVEVGPRTEGAASGSSGAVVRGTVGTTGQAGVPPFQAWLVVDGKPVLAGQAPPLQKAGEPFELPLPDGLVSAGSKVTLVTMSGGQVLTRQDLDGGKILEAASVARLARGAGTGGTAEADAIPRAIRERGAVRTGPASGFEQILDERTRAAREGERGK